MLNQLIRARDSFWSARQYLRLHPFDTETAAGRTKERHRRALLTLLANIFSRGISLVAMFAALRIALPYLGEERFGVMATMTSFAALLSFLDLGIGNSLVSQVARLRASNDQDALAVQIGNALLFLSLIGGTAAMVLSGLSFILPLEWAFKGASVATLAEARTTLTVFALLFGCSIPLGAAQRILAGLQEGYTVQLVLAAHALAGLLLLYFLPFLHAGIPAFLFATYGMQVLSGAFLLYLLIARKCVARPAWTAFRHPETRHLLKTGGLFFILQIGAMIIAGIDNILISSILGPASVTPYVIVQRLFMLVTIPLAMVNTPLWAAYAEAAHREDRDYIRATLKRSLILTPLAALAVASFIFINHELFIRVLTKSVVIPDPLFVFLYALWSVCDATGNAFAMYMNGMRIVGPQVTVVILFIAVSLTFKMYFVHQSGLTGLLSGTIAAYLLTTVLPYLTIFRKTVLLPISKA